MDMNCDLADGLCNLKADFAEYVADVTRDTRLKDGSFLLGNFNGRVYTYLEIDGHTVIGIQSETIKAIGKFELPDAMPPDFLGSDTPGD